jgi:hypothetical protein
MLQLYPQMQDKITLLGFLSEVEKIDGIVPPSFQDIPEEIFQN